MAINYPLNRDPFASGGVMDAPDVGLTAIMNKVAMGLAGQLTPQEHRRLATRQKLEEQSSAVAASKAAYQSILGQGPVDVTSYKGSMFKGADPFSSPANAALEARFGKRAPGQIDISYGAMPQGAPQAQPQEALLGQAMQEQPEAAQPAAVTAKPRYVSGFEQAVNAPPIPLDQFLSRNKPAPAPSFSVTEAQNPMLRRNEAIADVMRKGAMAVARPFQGKSWKPGKDAVVAYSPQEAYLSDLQSRYAQLSDKGSPTAVEIGREIAALSPRKETVGSMAGSIMKLPGAIGERPQMVGGTGAAQGYNLGSGPLAIDGSSSAGAANPPLSESVNADGSPGFSAEEKAQMQAREQQALRPAPMAPSASTIAAMDTLATEPDAVASEPAGALAAPETPAAPVDNRPTRIYAFGGGEPITQGLEPQARGYMAEPTGTTVSRAIAASPAARGAAVREAEFQNTLEQQAKKERETFEEKRTKNIGNALALDPNADASGIPKAQLNAARVMAAKIRKETGLDEQDNNAAYGKAIEETNDIPAGPEKIAAMLASFISNNGKVNPQMIEKMKDLAGAPVELTKIDGMTVVRAGNSVRILDNKKKPFDVNRAEKQEYSSLLIKSAEEYNSWDSLPNDLKSVFIKFSRLYPEKSEAGMVIGPREVWNNVRKDMVPVPAAPITAAPKVGKPAQARTAPTVKGTPIPGNPDWTMKPQ